MQTNWWKPNFIKNLTIVSLHELVCNKIFAQYYCKKVTNIIGKTAMCQTVQNQVLFHTHMLLALHFSSIILTKSALLHESARRFQNCDQWDLLRRNGNRSIPDTYQRNKQIMFECNLTYIHLLSILKNHGGLWVIFSSLMFYFSYKNEIT